MGKIHGDKVETGDGANLFCHVAVHSRPRTTVHLACLEANVTQILEDCKSDSSTSSLSYPFNMCIR